MSTGTSIEWTDATWNPTRGCSRVSEGCRNCYAERFAARMPWGKPFAKMTAGGPRWTGVVRLIPEKLDEPLRWKKPRRVFVNSTSDLFHESLDYNDIAAVYGIMAAAPRHTFQVLTKRPERRLEFHDRLGPDPRFVLTSAAARQRVNYPRALQLSGQWPLPNVWEGVSVEDEATADERIPLLLQTPASRHFVSYEPALGPVDFRDFLLPGLDGDEYGRHLGLDWIIVGGESGPGARPFDVAWARSTVEQCKAAGVACFVKQMGRKPITDHRTRPAGEDWTWPMALDSKGGNWERWPADLRVREFPA